jgi:hypothetical protein
MASITRRQMCRSPDSAPSSGADVDGRSVAKAAAPLASTAPDPPRPRGGTAVAKMEDRDGNE